MSGIAGFCFCDPFFWATVSMFALIGASMTLVSRRLRKHRWLNVGFVALFALGRFMIPLPCSVQPRFDLGVFQQILGLFTFVLGLGFMSAMLTIDPWPKSCENIKLTTWGLYGIVRNPMYLGELLWSLGWAVMWGSTVGLILMPLWWMGLLLFIMLEEEDLEACIGRDYLRYKGEVRGRILPGLPF